jgi:membrane protein YdbS with pleckstrin-like domain
MDDDKVEIRRGIITITHSLVPIERIHQVQVAKGPINRMFGLANVNITTAGGIATMEYLDEEVAESIASKLNEYVVRLLKDRD